MDAKKLPLVPCLRLGCHQARERFSISCRILLGRLPDGDAARGIRSDWEQRIQESPATAAEKRMAIRKFYSEAHTATADKQGRLL